MDEAEVDDDDEEEDEWEEGAQAIIAENDRHGYRNDGEGGPSARDIEGHRRLAQMIHNEKEDEIEEYYRWVGSFRPFLYKDQRFRGFLSVFAALVTLRCIS